MKFRDRVWEELRQLRHGLQPYRRRTTTVRRELRIRRAMALPQLARRRRESGGVWAVGLVRDEADIIEACVAHLLSQGVDHVLVADNLSTDGTSAILQRLAHSDVRVHVVSDREPAFHQAGKASHLARVARRCGADWILPFDADEFWFAEQGTLSDFLRGTSANTVRARVFNAVPVEADATVGPRSLLRVERRPQPLQKRVVRAHRWLRLERGNHEVRRTGPIVDGLVVLHLPYRGPAHLHRKHSPEALVDRLASAQPDQALQYRAADRLDPSAIDEAWTRLEAGLAEPRLNWTPSATSMIARALGWTTWQPDLFEH